MVLMLLYSSVIISHADQNALGHGVRRCSQTNYPSPEIPIVVNVCNFAKGDPCLLSTDDVRTLFHEFGHAPHQMLSNVTYRSLSGTSVARDFVELPSQLYEHWAMLPEILKQFARQRIRMNPFQMR